MENKKRSSALFVFSLIMLSLSTIAFALYTYFFVSMNIQLALKEVAEGSEQFGAGLGVAILLILMLIVGAALLILSVISTVLSSVLRKRCEGGRRAYALTAFIASISYAVLDIGMFLFAYIAI